MTPITKPSDLVGKTIASATYMKKPQYDDCPFLRLRFTDGTECYLSGGYGGFTGSSESEYPMFIAIAKGDWFERDDLPLLVEVDDDCILCRHRDCGFVYGVGWIELLGVEMRCPICDQKAMNCDCTPEERRQFSEIEDLENEISRMKMQSASEALAWSLGQMWVAVEDRMPEKNTPVLVVTSGVVTEMEWDGYAWYYGPNEAWEGCNTVTHWMPMPEPPRD